MNPLAPQAVLWHISALTSDQVSPAPTYRFFSYNWKVRISSLLYACTDQAGPGGKASDLQLEGARSDLGLNTDNPDWDCM
jgi:hypothetical protein